MKYSIQKTNIPMKYSIQKTNIPIQLFDSHNSKKLKITFIKI